VTGAAVNISAMPNSRPRVERIGHRGAPREYPENSLPAFARAIELGAEAVELDVHVSADGVPVVHHDPDIRVHAPDGRSKRSIRETSWGELSQAELAPGIQVPSLKQVLTLCAGRAMVYVELKGADTEEPAIAIIRAANARCAVHSFDHAAVARAARVAPEIRRGILFDDYPRDVSKAMRSAAALDVWPRWDLIDQSLVDQVHEAGGRVLAWTVNTTAAARQLTALSVDGLCGDDVRLLPR
jgi:glycerophosphoryl diester phosphodiesterase